MAFKTWEDLVRAFELLPVSPTRLSIYSQAEVKP